MVYSLDSFIHTHTHSNINEPEQQFKILKQNVKRIVLQRQKLKMSGFRIKLFRNGKKDSGLVISIPESYESLVNVASNKFEQRISKLYLSDGSLVTTINLIRYLTSKRISHFVSVTLKW
eukprot:TCONS_00020049-protein